ncbi:MAG: ribonucleoside triphosphate reductase [Candidatus Aenigmarchaeota archaeon]|nr:ribonucleoside triphosphate reductase [Candidatus Aenigmarchaeota archaeon]
MVELKKIIKRNGKIVDFDKSKISRAIFKSAQSIGGKDFALSKEIADKVMFYAKVALSTDTPTVEQVQDCVEKVLIEEGHAQTAKAYILYRNQRKQVREMQGIINSADMVNKYLKKMDWMIKENSNMGFSLQGLNNYIANIVISKYWLNKIYPKEVREAHTKGELHIHDLGMLATYCCGWELKDLLEKGFGGVCGKVESRPPKHFKTALGQVVNFFYTLQGETAGAVAFSNFDTYLAPFIKYDKLDYNEVKQAMQEFIFNINVPTRVGFQTPFTNITMDLTPAGLVAKENVIIGGKKQKETYADFQNEMDMLNRAFAEVMCNGDAKGRIFTFPIPTYNITKDFDWDNKNLDFLWEMTAKYGTPYFANFIHSDMKPDDARSMCCRLRLDNRELRKRQGGLFASAPLTGSIGVVTINMPRIGYISANKNEFFEHLEHLMLIAKTSLEIKRKILEEYTKGGLYPYAKFYLRNIFKSTEKYWSNHFSTIGIVGMNESVLNYTGEDIATKKGKAFALEIMDFMRKKLSDFQEETGDMYNLEATPAEGCTYRFAKVDKKQYPDIIQQGTNEPYYTNSSQLSVKHTEDMFFALQHQDELQCKYTGGTVMHLFLGERINDKEMCKQLVKKVAQNYKLPYFSITPTFSICPVHGYIPGEHWTCPICGEKEKKD